MHGVIDLSRRVRELAGMEVGPFAFSLITSRALVLEVRLSCQQSKGRRCSTPLCTMRILLHGLQVYLRSNTMRLGLYRQGGQQPMQMEKSHESLPRHCTV